MTTLRKYNTFLFRLGFAIVGVTTWIALSDPWYWLMMLTHDVRAQESSSVVRQEHSRQKEEPIAIDSAPEPIDPTERALRQARGKRYEGRGKQPLTELPEGAEKSTLNIHPQPLPPLPTSQSDAVVVGVIIGAQPYLSNDRTSIYTEFAVRIEQVLKNEARTPLNPGESITVEREGGALRLPSGRVLRLSVVGHGLPIVAGRHVLFLKHDDEGKDFVILKPYELRGGQVFPLDEATQRDENGRIPYRGADETIFLKAVKDSVGFLDEMQSGNTLYQKLLSEKFALRSSDRSALSESCAGPLSGLWNVVSTPPGLIHCESSINVPVDGGCRTIPQGPSDSTIDHLLGEALCHNDHDLKGETRIIETESGTVKLEAEGTVESSGSPGVVDDIVYLRSSGTFESAPGLPGCRSTITTLISLTGTVKEVEGQLIVEGDWQMQNKAISVCPFNPCPPPHTFVNCLGGGKFRATVTTPADLTITKNHRGDFASGSEETYTLIVTNLGPASTRGEIRVTDTLPAGLRFKSGLGKNWRCSASGQTVSCTNPGPLAPDESSSIILSVDVDKEAVPDVTNTACVSYENDINPANDCASDFTKVNETIVIETRAITKKHNGDFNVGTDGTYIIKVLNNGLLSDTGEIKVTDILPPGMIFFSATGPGWACSASGQAVTCLNPGPLALGESSSITLIVDVSNAAVPGVVNQACVTSGKNPDSPYCASDLTVVNPTHGITATDMTIIKSHEGNFAEGTNGVYTLMVTNLGPARSTGQVRVIDVLPTELSFVESKGPGWICSASGQKITCTNPAALLPGASSTVALTVGVSNTAPPSVTNTAYVWNAGDSNATNNSASDTTIMSCSNSISPTSQSFEAAGGIGTVNVTKQANCEVSVMIDADWIKLISIAIVAGSNNAKVTYRVEENIAGGSRTGVMTISGKKFTVTQSSLNQASILTSLNPNSAIAGGPDFTLTVNGVNFTSDSIVLWNGVNQATTFVNNTQLRAAIAAANIATAGSASIVVYNPIGFSNALSFSVNVVNHEISLEAEDGNGAGPVMPRSNANNYRTVWLHAGESLKLSFQLTAAGCYKFDGIRYSNDNFGPLEEIEVRVDGTIVGLFSAEDTGDFGYGWDNFLWSEPLGILNLQPGPHEMTLTVSGGDGYGVEIDVVKLSATPSTPCSAAR